MHFCHIDHLITETDHGGKRMSIYNERLFHHNGEWVPVVWSKMDGIWGYCVKWNKTDIERPGLYILSRIWKPNEETPCQCTIVNTIPPKEKWIPEIRKRKRGRGHRKSGTRLHQSTLQACVERPHSASSICTSSV